MHIAVDGGMAVPSHEDAEGGSSRRACANEICVVGDPGLVTPAPLREHRCRAARALPCEDDVAGDSSVLCVAEELDAENLASATRTESVAVHLCARRVFEPDADVKGAPYCVCSAANSRTQWERVVTTLSTSPLAVWWAAVALDRGFRIHRAHTNRLHRTIPTLNRRFGDEGLRARLHIDPVGELRRRGVGNIKMRECDIDGVGECDSCHSRDLVGTHNLEPIECRGLRDVTK